MKYCEHEFLNPLGDEDSHSHGGGAQEKCKGVRKRYYKLQEPSPKFSNNGTAEKGDER